MNNYNYNDIIYTEIPNLQNDPFLDPSRKGPKMGPASSPHPNSVTSWYKLLQLMQLTEPTEPNL